MKTIKIMIKILSTLLIYSMMSCNSITQPPDNLKIQLAVEEVTCTDAWLKITSEPGTDIVLNRDSLEVMRIKLLSTDTVIVDDTLLPNKSYSYQITDLRKTSYSGIVTAVTLDTTNYSFTCQSWTFGGKAGSCYLEDVAIINENNIWAVGAIYLLDSIGNL